MLPRVLAWIATAAGLVLIVVLVTGGFRFEAGPLRVSAHGVTTPLLLMAAASVAPAWRGSAHALDALSRTFTSVTTHAAAIAVISAARSPVSASGSAPTRHRRPTRQPT